jgi:hypothetical protein
MSFMSLLLSKTRPPQMIGFPKIPDKTFPAYPFSSSSFLAIKRHPLQA